MFADSSKRITLTEPSTDEFAPLLADKEFRRLGNLTYDNWGINLPSAKKTMVRAPQSTQASLV